MRVAVIGTREASQDQQEHLFVYLYKYFREHNAWPEAVYSGGAEGVDQVASRFGEKAVIFLPWTSYNNVLITATGSLWGSPHGIVANDTSRDTLLLRLFPWFATMKDTMKPLIRRDAAIVLGYGEYPPVDVVFWYTGKGIKGGTAYGIKIAQDAGIPIIEMQPEPPKENWPIQ